MHKLLPARLRPFCVASVLGAQLFAPLVVPAARAQQVQPSAADLSPQARPPLPAQAPSSAGPKAQSPPVPDLAAVPQEDSYILGPGDGLELRFLNLSARLNRSGPIQIISDGTATLPYIGIVRLTGLTLPQASFWLQALYRKQLLRSDLDLQLVRPRPIRVSLVGEVERPGIYALATGLPTLVNAIQTAGGVTGNADLRQVLLRRRLPGEQVSYRQARVDLVKLIRQGDQVQDPFLFDGDIIMLPSAPQPLVELSELTSSNIAPKEIGVYMVGEVVRPGLVTVKANTPLVQAVLAAGGGVVRRAKTDRVDLVRINRNGTLTRMVVALNLNAPPSPLLNPPLRDGDVVVVHRSNYARLTDTLDALGRPLTGLASILALLQLSNSSN